METTVSSRYLSAMGIEVWRKRQVPRQDQADTQSAETSPAAAPAGTPQPPPTQLPDPTVNPVPGGQVRPSSAANPPWLEDVPPPQEEMPPPLTLEELAEPSTATAGNDLSQVGWEALQKRVAGCRACRLCETRTQTVFGVGNPEARLLIIGEAPGAEEDRRGEPFVGRAGKLLDAMLHAIGLDRDQIYIANILKCRPPGNRDPRPDEALKCRPFLMRQIELIAPELVVAVGRVAAQNLLASEESLGRLRDHQHQLGPHRIPLLVSYHPAYLLRSPEQKAKSWADLQQIHRILHATA